MKYILGIKNFIDGNKTYIVAFGMIVYALLGVGLNLHTPDRVGELILAALALIGIRSGIKKLE